MATARLNHMSVACCDRAGAERGQEWTSGTTIVDQDGWVAGTDRAELDLPRRARQALHRASRTRWPTAGPSFTDL